MKKVTIILSEQQQVELQMILEDRDAAESLRFLKEVVWTQVKEATRQGIRIYRGPGKDSDEGPDAGAE